MKKSHGTEKKRSIRRTDTILPYMKYIKIENFKLIQMILWIFFFMIST